jgi:hypothetical protein
MQTVQLYIHLDFLNSLALNNYYSLIQ